ncbi:hypothetical protein, partial [Pseudoflavonifractor phocaeensis]|uniref:hypothetical protein n=1 Tax=Pseudoflavonifractor phocaeensis TaxID=1870988 RepID=UPI00195E68AD
AGESFSPVCFVMLFFSHTNFAGLFSFQLLTFIAGLISNNTVPYSGCFFNESLPQRRLPHS